MGESREALLEEALLEQVAVSERLTREVRVARIRWNVPHAVNS